MDESYLRGVQELSSQSDSSQGFILLLFSIDLVSRHRHSLCARVGPDLMKTSCGKCNFEKGKVPEKLYWREGALSKPSGL